MTPLQFSLFFVALVGIYLLVHARLVKLEGHLRELTRLPALQQRLDGLLEACTRLSPHPIEQRLDAVRADLGTLAEALARLDGSLRRGLSRPTSEVVAVAPAAPPAERVRELVETRLLSLGYGDLQILSDLSAASLEGDVEVVVECHKQQMEWKGKVALRNGAVRDVSLRSAAQTFP